MKIIDLTHTFTSNMPVFPGDPKSALEQIAYIEKDSYNDHKLTTTMHVGTHMDAPLHMIAGGKSIDEIPLERFIGQGILIDARGKKLDEKLLENVSIPKGSVFLLYTGFGDKFETEAYFKNSPVLSESLAKKLVGLKVKMVGMDIPGPDLDVPWPVHKIILGAQIPMLENLTNLDQLLGVGNFEVIALPFKLKANGAPVRVIAEVK